MRRFGALRPHGLSIFFGVIFLLAIIGQSIAGFAEYTQEQAALGQPASGYLGFLASSAFVVDVAENWQSEFLQFFLFIFATIWFVQTGSAESKLVGDEGLGTDEEQRIGRYAGPRSPRWARAGGWRTWIYSNSMLIVMGAIFLGSWSAQAIAGHVVANAAQLAAGDGPMTLGEYVVSPEFWNRTLQNWQSEFLAVGCMVAFSIYLRQRGSSESKPVGTPHGETSVENH